MAGNNFIKVKVQDVQVGDWLVNVGNVSMIEPFKPAKQVCLHVYIGLVESAAYYWYHYDTDVYIIPKSSL